MTVWVQAPNILMALLVVIATKAAVSHFVQAIGFVGLYVLCMLYLTRPEVEPMCEAE